MKANELPILIFGTGGASKEIYFNIKQINSSQTTPSYHVLGFVGTDSNKVGMKIDAEDKTIVAADSTVVDYINDYDKLGVVLPFGNPQLRLKVYQTIKQYKNLIFPTIIHPSVIFDSDTIIFGQGNIIAAGTMMTCNIKIGEFNLINLGCTIGHDVKIGNFNTINPLSAISGDVSIGDRCLIGAGSTILQALKISDDATIGAGAVLTKNVNNGDKLAGVPAKSLKKG